MIFFICNICELRCLEHQCKEHLIRKHKIKQFKPDWSSKYFRWVEIKI